MNDEMREKLLKAIEILYRISDIEDVVMQYLIATNTESKAAVEVLRLNQNNINELNEILQQ